MTNNLEYTAEDMKQSIKEKHERKLRDYGCHVLYSEDKKIVVGMHGDNVMRVYEEFSPEIDGYTGYKLATDEYVNDFVGMKKNDGRAIR